MYLPVRVVWPSCFVISADINFTSRIEGARSCNYGRYYSSPNVRWNNKFLCFGVQLIKFKYSWQNIEAKRSLIFVCSLYLALDSCPVGEKMSIDHNLLRSVFCIPCMPYFLIGIGDRRRIKWHTTIFEVEVERRLQGSGRKKFLGRLWCMRIFIRLFQEWAYLMRSAYGLFRKN